MKNDIFSFIWSLLAPIRFNVTDGSDGGSGDSSSDTGDGSGAGDGAGSSGSGNGAATTGSGVPNTDFRTYVDEKGNFTNPEWAKEYPNLGKKFTSVSALSKSYANLERQIGNSNKVAIPSDHSTPEEFDSFYNRLGRPETPDGYELVKPEGIPDEAWSETEAKGYSEIANKLGLTKTQASELANWQAERIGGATKQHSEALEAIKNEATAALKAEWGSDFDVNLAAGKRGAMEVGGEELLSHPLANDPVFIKAMAKVGNMIKEDGTAALREGGAKTLDPRAQIAAIRADAKHPYNQSKHPEHDSAVLRMAELYTRVNPSN